MKKNLTSDEVQDILQKLEKYISDLKNRWDQNNKEKKSWWRINSSYLISSTLYIINILDEIIVFVEGIIPQGNDKKTAVLTIITRLFEYIVIRAFPIWLMPFSTIIKKIVIDIIICNLIDYIVAKYNDGSWNKEEKTNEA